MAANKGPAASPDELRTLKLAGMMYAKEQDEATAKALADEIIKNTYRTLMTRGMKGCYVYCVDENLAAYLKECLKK